MTTATKSLSEMTTAELIQEDIENSSRIENATLAFGVRGSIPGAAFPYLRQRGKIRAELNRRHEANQS